MLRFFTHPRWTKFHRWITLLIGAQVVCWVFGGIVFTWSDLDNVHGDYEVRKPEPKLLDAALFNLGSAAALDGLSARLGRELKPTRIELTTLLGREVWAVYEGDEKAPAGLADARTAETLTPLGEAEVRELARADYKHDHPIRSIALLDKSPLDYRGDELPVWQVCFDNPKETRLYISRLSGKVLARRNWNWRLFDFFWMLHTMDFWDRDDFNHPLIRGASLLAGLVAVSGVVLLFQRFLGTRLTRTRKIP